MLRRRVTAVAAACVLVAGGCTHHAASSADPPTSTTVPASSTTPTSIDVTKVPPVIDLGYVTEVMKAINHIEGDAARHLLVAKQVDATVKRDLASIFAEDRYNAAIAAFNTNVQSGVDSIFANPPGDPVTTVTSIYSMSGRCVVAAAETDFSPIFKSPAKPLPNAVVQLTQKAPGTDPDHLNPTPWVVEVDGVPNAGTDLARACK